jgi:hypothetical protein
VAALARYLTLEGKRLRLMSVSNCDLCNKVALFFKAFESQIGVTFFCTIFKRTVFSTRLFAGVKLTRTPTYQRV